MFARCWQTWGSFLKFDETNRPETDPLPAFEMPLPRFGTMVEFPPETLAFLGSDGTALIYSPLVCEREHGDLSLLWRFGLRALLRQMLRA